MRLLTLSVLLMTWLLGACAALEPGCPPGMAGMVSETLYFGTAKPQGVVSAAEWAQFLAQEVTPRFPEGLSTWPAQGQWRGADGHIVQEQSHVLRLVHAGEDQHHTAVTAIAHAYRQRFQQEAVLRERQRVCVAF